jgi:hypothetical protein
MKTHLFNAELDRTNKVMAVLSTLSLFAALFTVLSSVEPLSMKGLGAIGICLLWGLLMYVGLNYDGNKQATESDTTQ